MDIDSQLPGARATILARLWGALVREPIPGIAGRREVAGQTLITLDSGQVLAGPTAVGAPFAVPPEAFAVNVDAESFTDPVHLIQALKLPGHTDRLAREMEQSVANLVLARAAQAPDRIHGGVTLSALAGRPDGLARLEQAVVDGHPLHPCCRTRIGMSEAEVLAYAPEHRPTVELEVFEVPPDRWMSTGIGLPPRLVVHPWQRDHVLPQFAFLTPSGHRIPAAPLMSLRTLAAVADPSLHYKTAVSVQMTSAVRIVSPAAVRNGPVVSALLGALAAGTGLTVWPEPAAGAVLGDDGEPLRELSFSMRRATLPAPGEVILPLAALTAPSPVDGCPLVREAVRLGYGGDPAGFLADLAAVVVVPLVTMLHRGVALEAHGQNVLLTLTRGRPSALSYRDIGGLRISPRRLSRHHHDLPPIHGDLVTDDPQALRDKAFASGITVALGEPIAVLSREYGVDPLTLWGLVRDRVRQTYAALPADAAEDAHALLREPLPLKATTAMRLSAQPLEDLWAALPNPMAAA